MAHFTEITKAADILGHPSIAKNNRGEAVPAPGQLANLVSEADSEFRKVVAMDPSKLSDDFVKSAAAFGFPVAGINRNGNSSGVSATMQRFGDSLTKLGVDADIIKEITLSGIGNWTTSDGPWLYDLDAPSKKVFPVLSPIRNKLPRPKGVGTSHRYRRIDGITGSQTGGVANQRISFAENVSTSFRGLSLNRPGKISYATSISNTPYTLYGLSDDLTWAAQYAGQGFEDLRGLIARNVLMAHMMGEEQLVLAGRTTALTAPTLAAGNLTQRAAGTGPNAQAGEAALTGQTTSIYVKVTAVGHFGESVASSAQTVTVSTGNVVDVTLNTLPAGSHGFRVYASTGGSDPGDASRFVQTWNATGYDMYGLNYTGGNVFTISGALAVAGAATPTADTSASANDFDGLMTQTNANGLVVPRLNSTLTLDAITKNVFLPGWLQFKSDVDEAWCHAIESIAITDLTLGAAGNPYRINVGEGDVAVTGGYRVDRMVNKVTGKSVMVTVHPYAEQGNILFLSYGLPFPYSEVPNVWEMRMVQDYLQIDWPVIQMSYDTSTFTFGSLIGYAPAYNAVLSGIQAR